MKMKKLLKNILNVNKDVISEIDSAAINISIMLDDAYEFAQALLVLEKNNIHIFSDPSGQIFAEDLVYYIKYIRDNKKHLTSEIEDATSMLQCDKQQVVDFLQGLKCLKKLGVSFSENTEKESSYRH